MESEKIAKYIRLFFLCAIILTITFTFNILAHEMGHYVAANHYGLDPSIHVGRGTTEAQTTFDLFSAMLTQPTMYTAYTAPAEHLTHKDAIVAFSGPLVNFLIALSILILYKKFPNRFKGEYSFLIFLLIFLPALAAGIINLLPFAHSDGKMIFDYFISLI